VVAHRRNKDPIKIRTNFIVNKSAPSEPFKSVAGRLRVVLVPDSVDWILGTWCTTFIRIHGSRIDFTILPVAELTINTHFAGQVLANCEVVHCLTQSGMARVLQFFDLKSPLPRPIIISTIHHIVEAAHVYDCLRCDAVLTVCEKYRQEVADLGIPEERIGSMRNGVDTDFFAPLPRDVAKQSFGVPNNTFVLGFAGKATSDHDGRKGIDRFIGLIEKLDATTTSPLMVITTGPGWEERFTKRQFRNIETKHLGFIDKARLPSFYNALDVYLTTAKVEGGPVPVLEAMSCGTCVVATPVGVVPEVIVPGKNGFIIPFDDDRFAVETIHGLMTGRLSTAPIGRSAREYAVSALGWDVTIEGLPAFYNRAVQLGTFGLPRVASQETINDIIVARDSARWKSAHRTSVIGRPAESEDITRKHPIMRETSRTGKPNARNEWTLGVERFLRSVTSLTDGTSASVPGGPTTLYGTIYAWQTWNFLGLQLQLPAETKDFVRSCQDPATGYFIGPELKVFRKRHGALHDSEHLYMHSTSTALPFCREHEIPIRPLVATHRFCGLPFLKCWTAARNWKNAWFEGNNILFVGQFLTHLRDMEAHPGTSAALDHWFEWLDREMDPATGLWGTNGFCPPKEAVYGGYHQLLVYYHENRLISRAPELVDTVLQLQHRDGGFNPDGNAGACEDVDSVDILVNCYKRVDYRRTEIRIALRQCLRHILLTQNPDGGFPYSRDQKQSHMNIPGTEAAPNVSCTFPTWFRIHTLALISEILPNEPALRSVHFRFNKTLSMGWHRSPQGWSAVSDAISTGERLTRIRVALNQKRGAVRDILQSARRAGGKTLRKVGLRK